jgi:hypothetical protein
LKCLPQQKELTKKKKVKRVSKKNNNEKLTIKTSGVVIKTEDKAIEEKEKL